MIDETEDDNYTKLKDVIKKPDYTKLQDFAEMLDYKQKPFVPEN